MSHFLVGCSVRNPVRYCRQVSALGPWVKCTRSGARNSASSGSGVCGTWGSRSCFGDAFLVFGLVVLVAGVVVALFATETKARVLEEISP